MSLTKSDRNIQSKTGNTFQNEVGRHTSGNAFVGTIASALTKQFTNTPSAIKSVARITGANERSVKNWFSSKNGPSGEHLIVLARHSDEVFEAILTMTGRENLVAGMKLTYARQTINDLLISLDNLIAQ